MRPGPGVQCVRKRAVGVPVVRYHAPEPRVYRYFVQCVRRRAVGVPVVR